MNHHQHMSKLSGKTQISASTRLALLERQGHQIHIDGGDKSVTATITRSEGYAHHITITPGDLPANTLNGTPFARYPQNILIAYAIHAIADWSTDVDRNAIAPCRECGTTVSVAANYDQLNDTYDWFCAECFYGKQEEKQPMGYWASATLTYGYDVTGQSPAWMDDEELDDPGEYGTRLLLAAEPDTIVRLAWDSHGKFHVLAAVWEHAYAEGTEIDSLVLPEDVQNQLDCAAEMLGYNVSALKPGWLLSAKFS